MITKRLLSIVSMFVLTASFLLMGCVSTPAANDPENVARAYREALNAGDIATAMSHAADNITLTDFSGKFSGKEFVRDHLELVYGDGIAHVELTEIHVEGNKVNYPYRLLIEGETVASDEGLIVVQNGKIVFDGYVGTWTLECRLDATQAFCADS